MIQKWLLILFSVLLLPLLGWSQSSTSANFNGTITDSEGEPLPGATIVAVHEPSGTEYGTTSRVDGRFNIRNARVGGPYTVQVSFVGFHSAVEEDISLELGQDYQIDFTLMDETLDLGEVAVTARRDALISRDRTGARSNISTEQIERNPTITRSLQDVARLSPQSSGGSSVAGRNNRFNNIQIDGATLNDVFGLAGTGTPGGQAGAQPIGLDAIAEFNVDVAPYDVRQGNFTGGRLNAVTRSGTNTFEGSAYYFGRNENLVGGGPAQTDFPEFSEGYYGARLGGPIIEDELFFFVNAEYVRENVPSTTGLLGSGQANEFPIQESTFQDISQISQDRYGYNPGSFDPRSILTDNFKLLTKLDWNMSSNHRLTFTNNYVNADDESGLSRGINSYDFDSQLYTFRNRTNTTTLKLGSSLSDAAFNEARVTYQRVRDQRDIGDSAFPQVTINLQDDDGNNRSIGMGVGQFDQANRLDQDILEFSNDFIYNVGDYTFTMGTQNQLSRFSNLFIRDYFGAYQFDSVEDFAQGNANSYTYSYSLIDDEQPEASFTALQLGLYGQAEWDVRANLRLTGGLRIDVPFLLDSPLDNPDAADAFGRSTTDVASGNILWQPRFGFNYTPGFDDGRTQIRGGAGLFAGPPPFVWISNQFGNTGVDFARISLVGDNAPDMPADQSNPRIQPGNPEFNDVSLPIAQTTELNIMDDGFNYPTVARFNLAVDRELPFGLTGTIEGIYSSSVNDVTYRNINLEALESEGDGGFAWDGRPIYGETTSNPFSGGSPNYVDERFTDVLLMQNTSQGWEYSISAGVERNVAQGFGGSFYYTYSDGRSESNVTSSQASSNWVNNDAADLNNPRLGRSDFVIQHRFISSLIYSVPFGDRNLTTFSLVYEGRSGSPLTWNYQGDASGTGNAFNDLLYIPENETDIFLLSENWDAYDSFIESEASLRDNRGTIAERGSGQQNWQNQLDLKVSHEIRTVGAQSIEFTATFINFMNIINNDWGVVRTSSFNDVQVAQFNGYVTESDVGSEIAGRTVQADDIGKAQVTYNEIEDRDDLFDIQDTASRWQLQFGVRYSF